MPEQTTQTKPFYAAGSDDAANILYQDDSSFILGKPLPSNDPFKSNMRALADQQGDQVTAQALLNMARLTGTQDVGDIESTRKATDKAKKETLAAQYIAADDNTRKMIEQILKALSQTNPSAEQKVTDDSKPWLKTAGSLMSWGGGAMMGAA